MPFPVLLRQSAALCLALLLGGCFAVNDFGDYWQQAKPDPALAGRWQKLADPKEGDTVEQIVFVAKDGGYDVEAYKDGEAAEDFDSPYPVRMLALGKYQFVLSRTRGLGGDMLRYAREGNRLVFYTLDNSAARALLDGAAQTNIKLQDYNADIVRLDAAAAAWLAAIPDDKAHWRKTVAYQKLP